MILNAVPNGISPEASEAARGTLGGAVAVSKELPEQLGAALLRPAREAFVQAFELTAVISAAVALVAAIGAAVVLRRVCGNFEPVGQPEVD